MRSGTRLASAATLVAIGVLAPTGAAHAAVSAFTMSPATGPPGTVVTVSGTGCTPGLLASSDTDFVAVTAPTLQLAMRFPVASNGSWHGTFTVPANGLTGLGSLPAPVAAVCISSSLLSLSTIYTPQTYVATGAAAPITLPPVTLPGLPVSVPTVPTISTAPATPPPGSPGTGTPGSPGDPGAHTPVTDPGFTVVVPGDAPSVANPDPPGGGPAASDPAANNPVANSSGPGRTIAALARKGAAARPATLEPADFGAALSAGGSGSGGLGWLGWLLLVALAVAAAGAGAWQRRVRRSTPEPEPVGGLD